MQPGELHLARSPSILKTVLGSCVGVTFWLPRLGIGALCHGVLPRCPSGMCDSEGSRYVDSAICHLLNMLEAFGAAPDEVQVKLFGGADVLPVYAANAWKATVGQQNCESALEVLRRKNCPVLGSDLGGTVGRTIQFHTGSGVVLVRRLARLSSDLWKTAGRGKVAP